MNKLESIIGREHMDRVRGVAYMNRKDMFRQGTFKCAGLASSDLTAAEVMQDGLCGCLDLNLERVCHSKLTI